MDETQTLTSSFLTSSLRKANNTACMLNKCPFFVQKFDAIMGFFVFVLLRLLEGWFQPNFKKHSHS